jgi:Ca2+/H+ antiporter
MLALVCLVVGLPILVGSSMEEDQKTKQDLAEAGSWLVIIWAIIMFVAMINAFANGCWRTGLVAFFI